MLRISNKRITRPGGYEGRKGTAMARMKNGLTLWKLGAPDRVTEKQKITIVSYDGKVSRTDYMTAWSNREYYNRIGFNWFEGWEG